MWNKKIIISGCFDGLHAGHLYLLKVAKSLAPDYASGKVVVGLNTDDYCTRVKGEGRPVNHYNQRERELLRSGYINEIIPHSGGDSLLQLIIKESPDFILVGDDYKAEDVVGRDLAQVLIVPRLAGISTTELLKGAK